jgi:photosystem II stability/assembly factor-like uncharacterized protein
MLKAKLRSTTGPLLAALSLAAATTASAVDLLELPAVQSGMATQALLLDVEPRGDGAYVAVGDRGVIIVSDENGNGWQQASVPASVMLTAVHFPTPASGWAVGHDGLILHSSDGGLSWEKQLDGHELNEQIIAVAERIVAQYEEEVEALQAEQTPDEMALEEAEFQLEEAEFMLEGAQDDAEAGPVRPLLDVWFRNEREGYVSGSYGMLLHTTDGGQSWDLVSERMDNPQAFHLNQIVVAPDGAMYIAGEAGYVFRSLDGGQTWDSLEPGYEGSFYGIVVVPGAAGSYELLAYGLRGNLFASSDRGETWDELDSGTTVTMTTGALLADRSVLLAGQGGLMLVRAPGGDEFVPARNPDRRVISGVVQRADGTLLLVGFGGVRQADGNGNPLPETSADSGDAADE